MKSTDLKKIGDLPTPYGVTVPVYAHPETTEEFLFDLDGSIKMAGVYGEAQARCKAEIMADKDRTKVRLEIFGKHGGHPVPRGLLPRPNEDVYPKLPKDQGLDIPIENWITAAMDENSWPKRAPVLLGILGDNIERQRDWTVPIEIKAYPLMLLLTATLEHLQEGEIDCIEAAAFYALCEHDEWSKAGVEWLRQFRRTWFRDWALARPAWQEFARMCRTVNKDLPVWIVRGTSA